MKAIGIIPSRYESKRFPGKPLIGLKGKSMIQHVYERTVDSKLFDEVIVATDDQRIFNHVQSFGGNVEMTSKNHLTGTDRCGEVVKRKRFSDDSIIVNIQGDEPLVDKRQLELLLNTFKGSSVTIATLGTKNISPSELSSPNRVKVVLDNHGDAMYFSRSLIPYPLNDVDLNPIKHIGLYAFKCYIFNEIIQLAACQVEQKESLEQLRWMYFGYKIRVVLTEIETPNIDSPEDVDKVLRLL